MKPKYSKKLFPFSPGIPWTIKNYNYVIPGIDAKIWDRVLSEKDFIIACYGGLMESFFSLSYCEALNKIHPESSIYWMGYSDFNVLPKLQGIAKASPFDLGYETIKRYPVPIFMDAENHAYFNVLNNYIQTKSFKSNKSFINKEIFGDQIYKNCMLPWDDNFPKIRVSNEKYIKWAKESRFLDNTRYILVLPVSWRSMHQDDCLGWSQQQIRELSALVRHLGFKVVSCGLNNAEQYYNSGGVISAPLDLEIIIGLIKNSWAVLSKDIDNLFVTMGLSKSSIIMSRNTPEIFDLYNNAEYFGAGNVIFTDNNLLPRDVYKFIEGLYD